MDNKDIFAKNLNKYMELNNKTRRDVCDALGFSYYTFTDWVKGRKYPRMDKVEMLANYFGIKKSDLIEEQVTEEMEIKSDIAVDITIRLGADVEFREIVKRVYFDEDFFELVKTLRQLDSDQIEGFSTMLRTFLK